MRAGGRGTTALGSGLAPAVIARLVVAVGRCSTLLGRGSGSTIGGRVGLVIDRDLLTHLGSGRSTVLVSGTNGKTTTTRLLAAAAASKGQVATSTAGANMGAGLVSALARFPTAPTAVLEVDEAHLGSVASALSPVAIVLLNLSRDQLDRTGEVRMLAERWRNVLATTSAMVVANADDPLVVWAAETAGRVVWVSTGSSWQDDAHHCPVCDARIEFSEDPLDGWRCQCGFSRPAVAYALRSDGLVDPDGVRHDFELALPGAFNRQNAAIAAVAAGTLGIGLDEALASMTAVGEVEGRFAGHGLGAKGGRLLLAKNPAGWRELITLVAPGGGPVVIGINARIADGHDPSWLWDVDLRATCRARSRRDG